MATIESRIAMLEERHRIVNVYPKGWPVLVPDHYTDVEIEAFMAEIGRKDIYRENDPMWCEMFIG